MDALAVLANTDGDQTSVSQLAGLNKAGTLRGERSVIFNPLNTFRWLLSVWMCVGLPGKCCKDWDFTFQQLRTQNGQNVFDDVWKRCQSSHQGILPFSVFGSCAVYVAVAGKFTEDEETDFPSFEEHDEVDGDWIPDHSANEEDAPELEGSDGAASSSCAVTVPISGTSAGSRSCEALSINLLEAAMQRIQLLELRLAVAEGAAARAALRERAALEQVLGPSLRERFVGIQQKVGERLVGAFAQPVLRVECPASVIGASKDLAAGRPQIPNKQLCGLSRHSFWAPEVEVAKVDANYWHGLWESAKAPVAPQVFH